MKRELKFRAWTGGQMEYDILVGRFGAFYINSGMHKDGLDPKDTASITPFNTIYGKETPIMQFTGMFDKEGKEIYEGDIVKVDNWKPKEIYFEGGTGFAGFRLKNTDMFLMGYDSKRMKIIGNIFENSDLLQ